MDPNQNNESLSKSSGTEPDVHHDTTSADNDGIMIVEEAPVVDSHGISIIPPADDNTENCHVNNVVGATGYTSEAAAAAVVPPPRAAVVAAPPPRAPAAADCVVVPLETRIDPKATSSVTDLPCNFPTQETQNEKRDTSSVLKEQDPFIVSHMSKLSDTSETYQRHFAKYMAIERNRAGSKFFATVTLLDHAVASWVECGGRYVDRGQSFDVDSRLLDCILEHHWKVKSSVAPPRIGSEPSNLERNNNDESLHLPLHPAKEINEPKVIQVGSGVYSDDFMYHIYNYIKVHAQNIHNTTARYRNSKRCLRNWYKIGGKFVDLHGVELSSQEALCAMEQIFWQNYETWLNEYIVI